MGFSIAWIAVRGPSIEGVLQRFGLTDTREADECNDAPITGSAIPYGWYVVFLNNICHPFTENDYLTGLSREGADVVCCQVEEHVMVSTARCFCDGKPVWSIVHDAQKDIYDLTADGDLPEAYAAILAGQRAMQDRDGGRKAEVDHIFDVPLLTGKARCGFEHSQWNYEWGEPKFTVLEAG